MQASVYTYPIYKLCIKQINGNVNTEVATREDLVAALQNNILLVEETEIA